MNIFHEYISTLFENKILTGEKVSEMLIDGASMYQLFELKETYRPFLDNAFYKMVEFNFEKVLIMHFYAKGLKS